VVHLRHRGLLDIFVWVTSTGLHGRHPRWEVAKLTLFTASV